MDVPRQSTLSHPTRQYSSAPTSSRAKSRWPPAAGRCFRVHPTQWSFMATPDSRYLSDNRQSERSGYTHNYIKRVIVLNAAHETRYTRKDGNLLKYAVEYVIAAF